MTELEPAVIGDELLRERVAELDVSAPGGPYEHWLGADTPLQVCGTSIPGNVHLSVGPMPPDPELPMLDLSWTSPDVAAILHEMLDRLDLLPKPEPEPSLPVITVDNITDLLDPEWPTQEMKRPTEEET